MKNALIIIVIILIVVGGIVLIDRGSKNSSETGSKIDAAAPDFAAGDFNGKIISKSDYQGKNILLYFNEGVGCPPCWQQVVSLQAEKDKFSSLNTEVLTVVVDPAATIKSTIETYKITSPVLIDDNKKVSTDYEVLNMNSSMHMGQKPGHTFVLIGSDNKIKWVGDYPEMNASTNEILEKVKASLQG